MPYAAFLHSHVSSWSIALILFFIAFLLESTNRKKAAKIIQMVLRVFYILILITGISLLFILKFPLAFVIKAFLAIWLIYSMEMILVRQSKGLLVGKSKTVFWLQFIISLVLVLLIGYHVIF